MNRIRLFRKEKGPSGQQRRRDETVEQRAGSGGCDRRGHGQLDVPGKGHEEIAQIVSISWMYPCVPRSRRVVNDRRRVTVVKPIQTDNRTSSLNSIVIYKAKIPSRVSCRLESIYIENHDRIHLTCDCRILPACILRSHKAIQLIVFNRNVETLRLRKEFSIGF